MLQAAYLADDRQVRTNTRIPVTGIGAADMLAGWAFTHRTEDAPSSAQVPRNPASVVAAAAAKVVLVGLTLPSGGISLWSGERMDLENQAD